MKNKDLLKLLIFIYLYLFDMLFETSGKITKKILNVRQLAQKKATLGGSPLINQLIIGTSPAFFGAAKDAFTSKIDGNLFFSSFQLLDAVGEMGEGGKAVEGVGISVERVSIGGCTHIFAFFLSGSGEIHHLLLGDANGGHVLQVEVAEGGGGVA